MKFFYRIFPAVVLMLFAVQCDEIVSTDLLDDPTAVSPDQVNVDYLLNNIQNSARSMHRSAKNDGGEMTRMLYMFGRTYEDAFVPESFNSVYQTAYSSLFIDVQNLLPVAEERDMYFHKGVAKVLQAYGMLTMVDIFGDVPWEEALNPEILEPGLSDDEDIYNEALALLDEAIGDLQNEDRTAFPQNDLYYGGHGDPVDAWTRAAKTMKFRAYLNMGDTGSLNELIADGQLILDPADDFTFNYSTHDTDPDSRHPWFSNYWVGALSGFYASVNYMNMLLNDKEDEDPRIRYYYYRQVNENPTDPNELTCDPDTEPSHFQSGDPWCLLEDGYWGRNHLIDEGIPPNTDLRTGPGVYPAGGEFDANQADQSADRAVPTSSDMGYRGAGIEPILMSSYTHFMIAEAINMYGTDDILGGEWEHLEEGVRQSIGTVMDFGADRVAALDAEAFAPDQDDVDDYVAEVEQNWNDDPLRTIAKEYYLALWPNGLESYNAMRRMHYPDRQDNLQPARTADPGQWYHSFSYPSVLIDRNANVGPKPGRDIGPFWYDPDEPAKYNF